MPGLTKLVSPNRQRQSKEMDMRDLLVSSNGCRLGFQVRRGQA